MEDDLNLDPLPLDAEEAMDAAIDCEGCFRRVALMNAKGEVIASVAGVLIGPEGIEQEGERFAEFAVSQDGMASTLRVPLHPDSRCTLTVEGILSGKLPNGASWVHEATD
ncbi:MAG: hypothetical protein QOF06_571 [Solirubrobacterales bacterium]|jgi:hypothetical protein|nr:hypothetical protein [Solirubrobacterales bacterium]